MLFAELKGPMGDPCIWVWVLSIIALPVVLIWYVRVCRDEEKQRRKEVDLAAEKEQRREKREQYRYKTARVMERGQKRQHKHERETQYPARPTLPPRQTRPALPPKEDDE